MKYINNIFLKYKIVRHSIAWFQEILRSSQNKREKWWTWKHLVLDFPCYNPIQNYVVKVIPSQVYVYAF